MICTKYSETRSFKFVVSFQVYCESDLIDKRNMSFSFRVCEIKTTVGIKIKRSAGMLWGISLKVLGDSDAFLIKECSGVFSRLLVSDVKIEVIKFRFYQASTTEYNGF